MEQVLLPLLTVQLSPLFLVMTLQDINKQKMVLHVLSALLLDAQLVLQQE